MLKFKETEKDLAFSKNNYLLFIISVLLVIVGFFLMGGGGSDDPNVFSYEIFNFRRIVLAPTICFIGYGLGIYAIMSKSKL